MKAVIIVDSKTKESRIRELISSVRLDSVSKTEVWTLENSCKSGEVLPVTTVVEIDGKACAVDNYLDILEKLWQEREKPELLIFNAGTKGNELASRLSVRLNGGCALSITGLKEQNEGFLIKRRVYGLQLEAEFYFSGYPCLFSIAEGTFEEEKENGNPNMVFIEVDLPETDWYEDYIETEIEDDSNQYNLMLAGGRGIGSRESALKLQEFGKAIHAGVGGSRPASHNGWFPTKDMIGLSGHRISPEVCVVFGASGCMPFMGGIDEKTMIIAINTDPKALIFKYSDLGIVDDCKAILESLIEIQAEEA